MGRSNQGICNRIIILIFAYGELLHHERQALFVISWYLYVPSSRARLQIHSYTPAIQVQFSDSASRCFKCCRCRIYRRTSKHGGVATPSSSLSPAAASVLVLPPPPLRLTCSGAGSDLSSSKLSEREVTELSEHQRIIIVVISDVLVPSCSMLLRGHRPVPGSVLDKQLKGITCL